MAKGAWDRLSPAQQYALRWAAMPGGTNGPRPVAAIVPYCPAPTFRSLSRRGLVGVLGNGWGATATGKALIPIEYPEGSSEGE